VYLTATETGSRGDGLATLDLNRFKSPANNKYRLPDS
jgi:hypothetical protein